MSKVIIMDAERARELWWHDPVSGYLYWKEARCVGHDISIPACKPDTKRGYRYVTTSGKTYAAHRVVWLMSKGNWPALDIDHIDGNPANNRVDNLREATRAENAMNRRTRRDSRSGIKGVHWCEPTKTWRAIIRINGQRKHIGYYDTQELAVAAYDAAALVAFGEFAKPNRDRATPPPVASGPSPRPPLAR